MTEFAGNPLGPAPRRAPDISGVANEIDGGDPAGLIARLTRRGQTLATAESITGGALCSRFIDGAGASLVVVAGIVAYATEMKHSVLGVSSQLLAQHGTVHAAVALAMARGAVKLSGATWGIATTGVAGPGPQEGHPAGTLYLAVSGPIEITQYALLRGQRGEVRSAAVALAVALLSQAVDQVG